MIASFLFFFFCWKYFNLSITVPTTTCKSVPIYRICEIFECDTECWIVHNWTMFSCWRKLREEGNLKNLFLWSHSYQLKLTYRRLSKFKCPFALYRNACTVNIVYSDMIWYLSSVYVWDSMWMALMLAAINRYWLSSETDFIWCYAPMPISLG